jgi:murein L,D-transpeptidase YafK/LysM repeat protein
MRISLLACLILCLGASALLAQPDFTQFKQAQMQYPNVQGAYVDKARALEVLLEKDMVYTLGNYLYIRVFKQEKVAEVWYRPLAANQYRLLKTYPLCSNSGDVGPKMTLADQKIPEGFYEVNRFAPADPHFLALGIGYPNDADRYRSAQAGNIELRGGCKSSGNMPFTDELMKEIYVLAVEAYSVGQARIPVHIFPARMEGEALQALFRGYQSDQDRIRFWNNIKTGYDYFNLTKRLPTIEMGVSGTYLFKDGSVPVVGSQPPVMVGSLNEAEAPPAGSAPTAGVPASSPPPTAEMPADVPAEGYHVVAAGETLYSLSKRYQHSVFTLKKWNGLRSDRLAVGQRLRVAAPPHYEVRRGDTLYSIAQRYGLSLEQLRALNKKRDDHLRVGEKLLVTP